MRVKTSIPLLYNHVLQFLWARKHNAYHNSCDTLKELMFHNHDVHHWCSTCWPEKTTWATMLFLLFILHSQQEAEIELNHTHTRLSGWTLTKGCSGLTPCCYCSLPFPISLFPHPVVAMQSHSLPFVLALAAIWSLSEPVQLSNPAEKLVSAELSLILNRLTWLTEGLTGACTQERDWVAPPLSEVN